MDKLTESLKLIDYSVSANKTYEITIDYSNIKRGPDGMTLFAYGSGPNTTTPPSNTPVTTPQPTPSGAALFVYENGLPINDAYNSAVTAQNVMTVGLMLTLAPDERFLPATNPQGRIRITEQATGAYWDNVVNASDAASWMFYDGQKWMTASVPPSEFNNFGRTVYYSLKFDWDTAKSYPAPTDWIGNPVPGLSGKNGVYTISFYPDGGAYFDPPGSHNVYVNGPAPITANVRNTTTSMLRLSLISDRAVLCAGGWNNTTDPALHGYKYLVRETGQIKERNTAPDPHITTLTAKVLNLDGTPKVGQLVAFSWDMPGNAPTITKTATTDANGNARVLAVSGDEMTKEEDETGLHNVNPPVKVTARVGDRVATTYLEIRDAQMQWQYKNEAGQYVIWNGEIFGLYSRESKQTAIPMRAVFTFDKSPVVGHPVGWSIDAVYDKSENAVLPDDPLYITYGRFLGNTSTTDKTGAATATFYPGYNHGQIVFAVEDFVTVTNLPDESTQNLTANAAFGVSLNQVSATTTANSSATSSDDKKPKRRTANTVKIKEYNWVTGTARFSRPYAYPAPIGEEDIELFPDTWALLRAVLTNQKESRTNSRFQTFKEVNGGRVYSNFAPISLDNESGSHNPLLQQGDWWISQAVGDDRASSHYHFADLSLSVNKKDKYGKEVLDASGKPSKVRQQYGAAFDIVLTKVPIFYDPVVNSDNAGVEDFHGYINLLRVGGFVAWHRWATASDPNSENEIHCIDPAVPIIKQQLRNQMSGYSIGLPNAPNLTGYPLDWTITSSNITAFNLRKAKAPAFLNSYLLSKGLAPGLTPSGTYTPVLRDAKNKLLTDKYGNLMP